MSKISKINVQVMPAEMKDWTTQQWAQSLKSQMARVLQQYDEFGQRLSHMVEELKSGVLPCDFEGTKKNWKHAYGDILSAAGLRRQDADTLMKFHKRDDLHQMQNSLPPSLNSLEQIVRLTPEQVKPLVKDKTINPDMTQASIRKVVREVLQPEAPAPVKKPKAKDEAAEFAAKLDEAHETYLSLGPKAFITEVVNLVHDKRRVSIAQVIKALKESQS